jgi:hypothetical protein
VVEANNLNPMEKLSLFSGGKGAKGKLEKREKNTKHAATPKNGAARSVLFSN